MQLFAPTLVKSVSGGLTTRDFLVASKTIHEGRGLGEGNETTTVLGVSSEIDENEKVSEVPIFMLEEAGGIVVKVGTLLRNRLRENGHSIILSLD